MKTVTKMKLSKKTLSILKNFANINSNILIKPGNSLQTCSVGKNIFVEAKIEEEFDTDIPIWDLNKFLGVVSMFQNPELEFNEEYVDISNGNSSVRYYYSDVTLLTIPTRGIKMPDTEISFDLEETTLNEILKASSILQVSDFKIVGKNGVLKIIVDDSANDTSNSFSVLIDENYSGIDYEGTINVSEIKFLPGSYRVELTKTVISKFTHNTLDLSYYISIKKG
jgi:hypothetical protein